MATLSPSQIKRRDWLRARLIKMEHQMYRKPLSRSQEERYGRYLTEYEALTAA